MYNSLLFSISLTTLLLSCTESDRQSSLQKCGNGVIDQVESCDGTNLGTATCLNLGYARGVLACQDDCTFDLAACSDGPQCGDGHIDGIETCDGTAALCSALGYGEGTAPCMDCALDLSPCLSQAQPVSPLTSSDTATCFTAAGGTSCWGANQLGILGVAPSRTPTSPVAVAGHHSFAQLAISINHTCAVDHAGVVWCFGGNTYGQLGLTEFPLASSEDVGVQFPAPVNPYTGFGVKVSTAYGQKGCQNTTDHTCMINAAGEAWCWGDNSLSLLAQEGISSSEHPVKVTAPVQFVDISTAGHHTCALDTDGAAWCWGNARDGILGHEVSPEVLVTGSATPLPVIGSHRFSQIDTGGRDIGTSCGVTMDDMAYCWGSGVDGALGSGAEATSSATPVAVALDSAVSMVGVGGTTNCAVTVDGALYCWGHVAGLPSVTVTTSATPLHIIVPGVQQVTWLSIGEPEAIHVLDENGRLHMFGPSTSPHLVSDHHRYVTVTSASNSWCALDSEGQAWCAGSNSYGHLGHFTLATLPARYPFRDGISWLTLHSSFAISWIGDDGTAWYARDATPLRAFDNLSMQQIHFDGESLLGIDMEGAAWTAAHENGEMTRLEHPEGQAFYRIAAKGTHLLDMRGRLWRVDHDSEAALVSELPGLTLRSYAYPCAIDALQRVLCNVAGEWQVVEALRSFAPTDLACNGERCCFTSETTSGVVCVVDGEEETRFYSLGGAISVGRGFLCAERSEGGGPACVSLTPRSAGYGQLGNGSYSDSFEPDDTLGWSDLLARYNL